MKMNMTKERLSDPARLAMVANAPVAEAALEKILASLDTSQHECECCELVVKHCFRDCQLAENIRATLQKLRRWAVEAALTT